MEEVKRYIPETLEEALDILAKEDCIILAGGSDIMVSSYSGMGVDPALDKPVLFISLLKELKGIEKREDGWVRLGALSTSREIASSDLVPTLVRDAASRMGAIALRNSATIGGNIGNASPKGDLPQPLILLDAMVELTSKRGVRRMSADDYILGAKKTRKERDELITSVLIPPHEFTYYYYKKVGMRRANAISKLTLSAAATVENGIVVDFRASSGAAGPKVARSHKVEEILIGKKVSELDKYKEEFLDRWNEVISPHAMPEYRRNTTRRMLEHFIDSIIEGAPSGRIL